jgi:hypothetical protein
MEVKDFRARVEDIISLFEAKLFKVDQLDNEVKSAVNNFNDLEKRLAEHRDLLLKEVTQTLQAQNADQKQRDNKLSIAIFKITELEPVVKNIQSNLKTFD